MEKNPYFLPRFSKYFIKQWAPIIALISAIILKFVKDQKTFQNNQAVESHFAHMKNHTMSQPQLEERNLGDFSIRRNVWEFDDFIRGLRERIE